MISSIVSRLVILVFGTLYPAYASYKAVRTKNVKEYVKWMMYWIVFALFTCAETFTDVFFSFWFPFYYEIKIILVLWLLSPATKGSSILYRRFVHPALIRREAEIDEALARATEQGYTAVLHLGTKGVNYATTVLMQTAIKGGGGLVQQLRKSYSLSDLTGEKEDENRNTPDARDETDMEVEPRRREHVGRRGYSPRRTQSSSNASRVEMYFSEVDVDVRQPRPREPITSLTNIRSSDDISSGYSSGEALQTQRTTSQGDSLVRTSSVGARTRMKPRTTTKKTPEDMGEDFDCIYPENVSLPSSLNVLTPEQALELLLLLSQNNKSIDQTTSIIACIDQSANESQPAAKIEDNESSSTESSGEFVDTDSAQIDVQTIEITNISTENVSIPMGTKSVADKTNIIDSIKESDFQKGNSNAQIEYIDDESTSNQVISAISQKQGNSSTQMEYIDDESKSNQIVSSVSQNPMGANLERITGEICQEKFNELKQLLDDAHKAVTGIVSSQEKLNAIDGGKGHMSLRETRTDDSPSTCARDIAAHSPVTPSTSSCDLDSDNRAGKYHKKPAPKAPMTNEAVTSNEDSNENESQNALKATLVIKTGTLRTVSNADATKDIFLAHNADTKKRKKKSSRTRAKESFSKLLTIPKNIFHSAFHKEQSETSSKEEDSSSTYSETSGPTSRSGSIGSQVFVDTTAKLSASKQENREVDVEEIPLRPERDDNINSDKDINSFKKLDTEIVPLNKVEVDLKIENNKKEEDTLNLKKFENPKSFGNESNLQIREASQSLPYSDKKEIITDIN
ncbi:putative leucine-rich repeat-containing protein DDB_G0290503 isoform X2 [Solenopsis invicta]|uniref:putative leucine-rich repeat-containing protein DDB_G0290503 isoform X2 n=1 Tax=Solenopsis invicta TaxID=13686 RepID=UPI000595D13B|nr:putative leucine-rich repeat-containing protein DDB_G0290503 isoform X2 [Solenopsis invicta]